MGIKYNNTFLGQYSKDSYLNCEYIKVYLEDILFYTKSIANLIKKLRDKLYLSNIFIWKLSIKTKTVLGYPYKNHIIISNKKNLQRTINRYI